MITLVVIWLLTLVCAFDMGRRSVQKKEQKAEDKAVKKRNKELENFLSYSGDAQDKVY